MRSNTLYIMCGLPYSGKTTLRESLVRRFGFSVVSIDEIMQGHRMWDKERVTQADWDLAYSETYDKLKRLLGEGRDVIFDSGALNFHEREIARKIAQESGASHKLIYVNTSKEEVARRRAENEKTKSRGHVKDYLWERTFAMFEEPRPEENPIIYNSTMDKEEWIRKNIEGQVQIPAEVK